MQIKIDDYDINGNYPSNYLLVIDKIQHVVFSLKSFPLPGINGDAPEVAFTNFNNNVPPDSLMYNELLLTIFLDEAWQNHKEIHQWLYNNATGVNTEHKDIYSGGTLFHYNNSLKKAVLKVDFKNLQPINIGDIDEDNITLDDTVFTVTMKYDKYTPNYLTL